jgi:hypothetical protein
MTANGAASTLMWRTSPDPIIMLETRRPRRWPALPVSSWHHASGRGVRRRARVVRGLRSVARRSLISGRARRSEVLLCGRVASVRPELLDLAALLQTVAQPTPAVLEPLERLLRDGCHSPLYNPDVHQSELRATLYYARVALQLGSPRRAELTAGKDGRHAKPPDRPDIARL